MEIQPSSIDWSDQESFSLAVLQQQHSRQRGTGSGCPWDSKQICTAHVDWCFADLVTVALGTQARLTQGRASAVITHSMSQVQCTLSVQLVLGLTDSASRKKSSLCSTSLAMAPLLPDNKHDRATPLAPLQPRIPLMWRELLSCRLSLALWCRGMQTSSIPYDPFLHLTWRQGAYQNSFTGSPASLRQLWSWVALGICALHKYVIFFIVKWTQRSYC